MIRTLKNAVSHPYAPILVASLTCLCVFLFRLFNVIDFQVPLQMNTSGSEEESLFALYKFVHGEGVYQDPHKFPFAASYFNWLFYWSYGQVISWINLSDEWLPTVGRVVTLGFTGVGYVLLLVWFRRLQPNRLLAFALASFVMFSPIMDYWGLTVRPDIAAFVFEIAGIFWYFQLSQRKPFIAMIGFAICCYLAWSFKQINIVLPISMGIFLLWHRRWKEFLWMSFIYSGLIGLTLIMAPSSMLDALFFSDTSVTLYWLAFYNNTIEFILFSFPFWFILFSNRAKIKQKIQDDALMQFACCGLIAWACIMIPASFKTGSNTNYHFLAILFAAILVIQSVGVSQPKWVNISWFLLAIFFGISITNGHFDIDKRDEHMHNLQLKACMGHMPKPIFIENPYASLPWMSQSEPPVVLAYNYWSDKSAGYIFEGGGLDGYIQKNFFKTLILSKKTQLNLEQAHKAGYSLGDSCQDMLVYYEVSALSQGERNAPT